MRIFDGYIKRKLGDLYVLLAGGGHKALSDFAMITDLVVPLNLASVTKTLTVDNWETIETVSDLVGTYAIQINSGTLYASGIFSACGGSDVMIDEIPLHVVNSTNGSTWRPYARISGGNLLMTTNETTGTSRQYIINIIKLI